MEDTFTFEDLKQTNTAAKSQFLMILERLFYLSEFNKDGTKTHLSVSYLTFVRQLIMRLPICPICSINSQKRIVLTYRQNGNELNITVLPARAVSIEKIFIDDRGNPVTYRTTGIARPDFIQETIMGFYQKETKFPTGSNTVTYRKVTTSDYGFISAILQTQIGPQKDFKITNMSKYCKYAYIAVDPYIGPMSFAIILGNDLESTETPTFDVLYVYTNPVYRGLGFGEKCLREAIKLVTIDYPECEILFDDIQSPQNYSSQAHTMLKRLGFAKEKIDRGAPRYTDPMKCVTCPHYLTRCSIYTTGVPCNLIRYRKVIK